MAFGLRDLAQVAIVAEDKTGAAFDSVKRNVAELRSGISGLQGLLAGVGVGLSAGAFATLVKNSIEATAALDDLKDTTALTVETLSSLQQTARIGGHSFDTVTSTATKFAKSVAEAAGGNKELLRSFEALGISQERLRTSKFDDLYTEFATKIATAENRTYAIAYATDLAGKSAANALPFFKDLSETGLEQARVNAQQAAAADELTKQIGRMGNAFDGIVQKIGTGLVPVMSKFVEDTLAAYDATNSLMAALLGVQSLRMTFGESAAEQIRKIDAELSQLKQKQGWFDGWLTGPLLGIRESGLMQGRAIALSQQRLEAQRHAQSVGTDDVWSRRAASAARVTLPPPPSTPGAADTAGPQLIAQLTNQLGELNGQGSVVEQTIRKLTDGTKQYTIEVQATALALAGEIDGLKRAQTAREAYVKAMEMDQQLQEEVEQLLVKQSDAQAKANVAAYEAIERVKLEAELLGVSNVERERRIALLDLEKNRLALTAEQYERYRAQMNEAFDRKAAAEAHQKFVDDVKRQNEQIAESLTDALLRGFESGKSWAANFAASLKNMFASLVLRPIIQPIAQGAAGAVGGLLGGLGVPGYANAASYGGLGSGLFNQGLSQLLDPVLSGVGASVFGGAGVYSSALGLSSSAAGSQAALLAAQTGEFGLAGLSATASSAGAAGASALTSALPYVGMALAAYSLMKSGSKGGPAHFTGLDVSGTGGIEGLLSAQFTGNSANSKQAFSWASHDHNSSGRLGEMIRGVYADMAKLAEQLGLDPGRLSGATAGFSFRVTSAGNNGMGPTTQEVLDSFGQNLGQLTDQLAMQLMPNLKQFAQANESATQTLVRLVQVQEQLTAAEAQQKTQLAGAVRGLPGALGITGLESARDALATSEYVSPLDRLTSARGLLDRTYQSALGGDLSAISAFPQVLQQALSIGRDVGASGPAFQQLFLEGNRQLNELLARQQQVQAEILQGIDVSILQASQDQVAELKRGFAAMVAQLDGVQSELRRIRAA